MRVPSTANVVAILNEACSNAAAGKLVEAFGGQEIAVPKTVSGRLVETFGPGITAVLVDHVGSGRPQRASVCRSVRRTDGRKGQ